MTLPSPRRTRRVWGIGGASIRPPLREPHLGRRRVAFREAQERRPLGGQLGFRLARQRLEGGEDERRPRTARARSSSFRRRSRRPGTWPGPAGSSWPGARDGRRGPRASDRRGRAPGCRSREGTGRARAWRRGDAAPWAGRTARGPSRRGRPSASAAAPRRRRPATASPTRSARRGRSPDRRPRGSAGPARRRRRPSPSSGRVHDSAAAKQAAPGHPQRVSVGHLHQRQVRAHRVAERARVQRRARPCASTARSSSNVRGCSSRQARAAAVTPIEVDPFARSFSTACMPRSASAAARGAGPGSPSWS